MNTSVLIYSCDKYEDAWEPFFTLFFRYWDCPYPVYLCAESKKCDFPGVTTINTLGTWTERMQKAVREIPTKYVIGMCEDFFFRRPVKQGIIKNCVLYMEHDHTIGCFNFEKECEPGIELIPSNYLDFAQKPKGNHFQKSCQPTLWRRTYLEKLLDVKMNAWEWEETEADFSLKHYIWNGLRSELAFEYGYIYEKWFGIQKGKWVKDDVVPMFEREGIEVDFSKRGFV